TFWLTFTIERSRADLDAQYNVLILFHAGKFLQGEQNHLALVSIYLVMLWQGIEVFHDSLNN
ncbi:hypothetical protein, partial [Brevibacillus borstelensis]|uniref:hypothetical protein n=1 Tax=Brevibacillus borstelensis TaxID=45462 RepID=UPI002E22972A|nr:hypothetical protein [Brevibacillus borstelensis]